jgi:hypothetical protein
VSRRRAVAAAALGACVALTAATRVVLPPAPAAAPASSAWPATDLRVAVHVHTTRSDGTGTPAEVARAARRAGLHAVVLTDHGDGTRAPDPPATVDGVLVIDGAEIGTWGGHYVAIGAAPAPYPLGGEPRAVVEDVRRLGGAGFAAHPGSSRDGLRWRDWDAAIDGLEWLNADSEWRDRPAQLWRTALAYPWRPAAALAALIDTPAFELAQWDRLAARRRVAGIVAHDAHARLGIGRVGEPYDGYVALAAPDYASLLASMTNVVRLPAPPSGDPRRDAAAVIAALADGRSYGVVSGVAAPGSLAFTAESGGRRASFGEHLAPAGAVTFVFSADVPPAATSRLVCDGRVMADAPGGALTWATGGVPGACRAEVIVARAGGSAAWLVTNPIYVRPTLDQAAPAEATTATVTIPVAGSGEPGGWIVEAASDATGQMSAAADGGITFTWTLGPAAQSYAAIQRAAPPHLREFDSVVVRGTADAPRRLWLQLRAPAGAGQRWGRSIYLDATPRDTRVPFATLLPMGDASTARPALSDVTALLVVVDTVYAAPGSGGRVTLQELRLAR